VNPVRRLVALLGLLSLLLGLASCGDQKDASASSGAGLEAVTVSGDFGQAPEVKWNSTVDTDELASKTLIEGKGAKVVKGDQVLMNIWIGNGYSQREQFSTWAKGHESPVTVDDTQINKAIYTALADHTIGSRIEVVSPPKDAFGEEGNATLGFAPTDHVVFVIDIMRKVLTEPSGAPQKPSGTAPRLLTKDGVPTGFDFMRSPKTPSDKLQVFTLIKGAGPRVATGDTTIMNYLGEIYGTKNVFDKSYGSDAFTTPIGAGKVIKGWDQGLVGVSAGSRVVLVIPPDLAYGKAGQGSIKGNQTLVFVVDILATY
jgi:peptidylprolyl isomerase